ncbi:deoxynucleoside kinase [Ketobacter sp. MCCC 1A13808]|uniref:deoxynucleoside kinase n=1 Tax=Ketobacter sp. MCCC 1A13808 TaxID=2602738 RepID=UPI000F191922|nr:deoxynucleoside kinase [Ketobacter sp. MCCC 1A13808]MVF13364.1 deoxynucleoside kinase [Ketobacter sp. MCCC 1A13808]RLP54344.1 MAG: deoxynucleoside kinase [Ketobacter sp.]
MSNPEAPTNSNEQPPKFVVVEGPIGVGKTTLTKKLAATFGYELLLEGAADNPFLERFYEDQQHWALQTQLFFLLQRADQLNSLRQNDLFQPVRVADFLIHKDRLFAGLTLADDELILYDKVYQHLITDIPKPDLVIYLQAPTPVLKSRIERRGIICEQQITDQYLDQLSAAYHQLFHYYDESPLLMVNTAELNLAESTRDYENLVEYILSIRSGRHHFYPLAPFDARQV